MKTQLEVDGPGTMDDVSDTRCDDSVVSLIET